MRGRSSGGGEPRGGGREEAEEGGAGGGGKVIGEPRGRRAADGGGGGGHDAGGAAAAVVTGGRWPVAGDDGIEWRWVKVGAATSGVGVGRSNVGERILSYVLSVCPRSKLFRHKKLFSSNIYFII